MKYGGKSNRPLIEGDKLFKAKHVVSAGVIRKDGTKLLIKGLVLQTSQPKADPHEVISYT